MAFGGVGALFGALLVRPITRRFGLGPTIVAGLLIGSGMSLLIWLAGGALAIAVPLMIAVAADRRWRPARSRQIDETACARRSRRIGMLGRVNASMSVLGEGIGTLGADWPAACWRS